MTDDKWVRATLSSKATCDGRLCLLSEVHRSVVSTYGLPRRHYGTLLRSAIWRAVSTSLASSARLRQNSNFHHLYAAVQARVLFTRCRAVQWIHSSSIQSFRCPVSPATPDHPPTAGSSPRWTAAGRAPASPAGHKATHSRPSLHGAPGDWIRRGRSAATLTDLRFDDRKNWIEFE